MKNNKLNFIYLINSSNKCCENVNLFLSPTKEKKVSTAKREKTFSTFEVRFEKLQNSPKVSQRDKFLFLPFQETCLFFSFPWNRTKKQGTQKNTANFLTSPPQKKTWTTGEKLPFFLRWKVDYFCGNGMKAVTTSGEASPPLVFSFPTVPHVL